MRFSDLASLGVSAIALLALDALEAQSKELPGQPRRLLACPFSAPSDDLGYAAPKALSADDSDDDDDDDSSSSDDAIASIQMKRNECLFLGGSVTHGFTLQRNAGPSVPLGSKHRTFSTDSTTAEIDVSHVMSTDYGDLVTRFGFNIARSTSINAGQSTAPTLVRASLGYGPWLAGLDTSLFDTWTGDPFSFAALTPVATTGLIARQFALSDNSTLSFSIENPATARVAKPESFSGMSVPDMIARYRWANSLIDVVLTGATHVVDDWANAAQTQARHDWGYAAKAYLKVTLPTASDGSYVLAQATYGYRTPFYLGITSDSSRRSRFQLDFPSDLTAKHFEHGHGWSADFVANYAISDTWSTAAFVSLLQYGWYSVQSSGEDGNARVKALRSAWNVTWTPVTNLSFAGELGVGYQHANKLQGKIYPVSVGNVYTATFTVKRTL